MILELKHGKINCSLQPCNEAFINAVIRFESEIEMSAMAAFESNIGLNKLLAFYAYFSHKHYCSRNGKIRKYTLEEFEDAFTSTIDKSESNLEELSYELGNTVVDFAKKKGLIPENPEAEKSQTE